MTSTSADAVIAEVASLAYHFHWDLDQILDLEHPLRQRFLHEIDRLNANR